MVLTGYNIPWCIQLFARIQRLPTNIPRLVSVRNFVSCLRLTYRSSAARTENSSFHSGWRSLGCGVTRLSFPDVIRHVENHLVRSGRRHHEDLGRHPLLAEPECVDRFLAPAARHLFRPRVSDRLARAYGCAHGFLSGGRTVVTHVALHHLLELRD